MPASALRAMARSGVAVSRRSFSEDGAGARRISGHGWPDMRDFEPEATGDREKSRLESISCWLRVQLTIC